MSLHAYTVYCLGWVMGSWVDIMIFVLVFNLSGVVPRLLCSLVAKIAAFREYSVFFVDDNVTQSCVVQTWDDHELFCVSIHVEACGQRIPIAELAGLLRIVDKVASCQLPLSCQAVVRLYCGWSARIVSMDASLCFARLFQKKSFNVAIAMPVKKCSGCLMSLPWWTS